MQKRKCLHSIKENYESLTPTEKKAADFIRKDPERVISMSIAAFSEESGVVKSAVVRCCRKLHFDGYADMKLALAAEISRNSSMNYIPYIYPEDSEKDILGKIFSADIKTLHDTAESIDRQMLRAVTDGISAAKNVYIYGIGTSAVIVNDFQYRLMQAGYNAFCYTDVPFMKISTLNIGEADFAIGISNSGRTVATIEALQLAKAKGAKTACITSYPDSRIVGIADFPLVICSDEIHYPMEAISARIAHLALVDTITVALSARDRAAAAERAKSTYELINTIRYDQKEGKNKNA